MPESLEDLPLDQLVSVASLLGEEMTFFPSPEMAFAMHEASSRGPLASQLDRLALTRQLDKVEKLVEGAEARR
jgi:hypothetical protein